MKMSFDYNKTQRVLKLVLYLLDRPDSGASPEKLQRLLSIPPRTLRRYLADIREMAEFSLTLKAHPNRGDRYYLKREKGT